MVLSKIIPVLFQKEQNTVCQKIKKRFATAVHDRFRNDKPADGRNISATPAVKLHGQGSQICPSQIKRQVAPLLQPGRPADVAGNHFERTGLPGKTAFHFFMKTGDQFPGIRNRKGKHSFQT